MYRISRIYVGNYGHKMCWYDGVLLNFIDSNSGEASDQILQLENGGGKSTLLAGIFSCFETSQNRFLKHLQENRNRFLEYFSSDGLPGFVLVEWMIPTSGPQEYRRIITGQVVAIKSKLTNDYERVFFSFETAPDLALESVPAPKLHPEPAISMDDFSRWLSRIKREYKGNVFDTRNHGEWEQHLEQERGIDVGMLKLQVEFSRTEGSIDTAFLNFRNETEFLQKFLTLTMDAEQAASVRNNVITACEKLKRKPEFVKRLDVLSELHGRLSEFEKQAIEHKAAKEEYLKSEYQSACIVSTLKAAANELRCQATESIEIAKKHNETVQELKELQADLRKKLSALTFISLKRKHEQSRFTLDSCTQALQAISEDIRYLSAARSFASLTALKAKYTETKATVSLAEEGLQPFIVHAQTQGKILKVLLLQHKTKAEHEARSAKERAASAREKREQLKSELAELNGSISKAAREQSQLQLLQKRHEQSCLDWYQKGVLGSESESLMHAITRLQENVSTMDSTLQSSLKRQENLDQEIRLTRDQLTELKAERASKEEAIKNLKREIANAEADRDAVSQNQALCRAAESEFVDPDADGLPPLIDRYAAELQRMRDAAAVLLAHLNQNRTEIETTGLAAANPDVQLVLAELAQQGIKTACAYNSYIAQTEPDPDHARDLVLSNPSRFFGVAIKTDKELAEARKILENPPSLSKPVFVSLIANSPDPVASGFVIAADNDAAYNFESAKQYSAELSDRLAGQSTSVQTYGDMYTAALEGRQKLQIYLGKFGKGQIQVMKQDLASLEGEDHDLVKLLSERGIELRNCELELVKIKESIKEQQQSIEQKRNTLSHIQRDYDELEKHESERKLKLHALDTELEKLKLHADELSKATEQAFEAAVQEESLGNLSSRHAEDLYKESALLRYCDENFDADASLNAKPIVLEAARELYKSAAGTLDYEERNRLGVLKKELEYVENELNKSEASYLDEYSGLEQERVASLVSLDFAAEVATLKHKESEAKTKLDDAKAADAISDNELKQFRRKNPEADKLSQDFIEISNEELSSELNALPVRIEGCDQGIAEHQQCEEDEQNLAKQKESNAELYESQASTLAASLDFTEEVEADMSLLSPDHNQVKLLIAEQMKRNKATDSCMNTTRRKAEEGFRLVQKSVFSQDLRHSEPEVALLMGNHDFESACAEAERLSAAVADRMAVSQTWLDSVKSDFDSTVEELLSLVGEGIRVVQQACNKRLPEKAPFLGGKPIIKMKVNLNSIATEQRRQVLADFMDSVISTGMAHKTGTDMIADAIQRIAGRNLGIHIAKLTREESEQYASADKLSNSGGEAVSMALFLYILTAQIRAEMQADLRRQPGGPLILDNPFAKASSPFIWRAQRAFARAMGVQLIFASATKDLDTLGEFENFIYLRKAGVNNKTGRYHIEQVDLALNRGSVQT